MIIKLSYRINERIAIFLTINILCLYGSIDIFAKESQPEVELYYFYSNACDACTEAQDLIDTYISQLSSEKNEYKLNFHSYNVIDAKNLEMMLTYFDRYHVAENKRNYPIIFYSNTYYQGKDIEDGLLEIDEMLKQNRYTLTEKVTIDSSISKQVAQKFKSLTIMNVVIVGIVNGFNPCGLSMILFLITLLITKKEINMLRMGIAFAVGKVITYILLGTVLYNSLSMINMQIYNSVIKIIFFMYLVIIIGMNIYDYYQIKNQNYGYIKNQLPSALRKLNHIVIQKFFSMKKINLLFITLLLGSVISVGEFLCTGQVYVATIVYLYQIEKTISLRAFVYLCIYAIAFVIPMILVIYGIHKTKNTVLMSNKILEKLSLIKIITSVVLVLLGIVIFIYL